MMTRLQPVATRLLMVGAVAVLITGCASGTGSKGSITLSGSQEVPPVTTSASGTSNLSVNPFFRCPSSTSGANCPSVFGGVTINGIAATAAHIHMAPPGQNGPVILPLVKLNDNTWVVPSNSTLTADQYSAYLAGNTYVNVHSDANKGGEIRGQLKP